MQFSRSFLLVLFSAVAFAQEGDKPNPFTYDLSKPFSVTAGEPVDIKWTPTTGGTITLILRQGSSSNLSEGTIIAKNIDNTGSFKWTPDADTVRGSNYALQIVDDQDETKINYSQPFVLESDNTVASTTNIVSLAAPTSSLSLGPTLRPTATPSAFPTTTGSESETTGTSTASETSSSAENETSGTSSATSSAQASSTSQAGGARATAMAGMLGVVALGALAL